MNLLFSLFFASVALINARSVSFDHTGYKVYQIVAKSENHFEKIEQILNLPGVDVWFAAKLIDFNTTVMVSPELQKSSSEFMKILKDHNLQYQISIDNVQRIIDEERDNQVKYRQMIQSIGYSSNLGINFTEFHRFDEVNSYLTDLSKQYPDTTELINIGKSYQGRELNILKVTNRNSTKKKPAILIDGGIHAREWIAPATVLYIISQLVENATVNHDLTDEVDWYLLPVLNPDGYEYSHTYDRLWRKTRQPTSDNSTRCVGVDGNRNFEFHWEASPYACTDDFPGFKSFSEPETRAIRNFGLKIKDQLQMYLTFHSCAQMIIIPYTYDNVLPDDYDELETLAVQVNGAFKEYKYRVGTAPKMLYPAPGTSEDWFKGVANSKFSYTIELPGSSFIVPPERILPIVADVFLGVRVFGEYIRDNFGNDSAEGFV